MQVEITVKVEVGDRVAELLSGDDTFTQGGWITDVLQNGTWDWLGWTLKDSNESVINTIESVTMPYSTQSPTIESLNSIVDDMVVATNNLKNMYDRNYNA